MIMKYDKTKTLSEQGLRMKGNGSIVVDAPSMSKPKIENNAKSIMHNLDRAAVKRGIADDNGYLRDLLQDAANIINGCLPYLDELQMQTQQCGYDEELTNLIVNIRGTE